MLWFDERDEEVWLKALPAYQSDVVEELLKVKSPEDAATAWLEASIDNTSPFGGQPQPKRKYLELLKVEVRKLLCGSPEYDNERNELDELAKSPANKTAIVSMVSAVIGAKVGLAATFIAPAIVIIFIMVAKTSLNAWCAMETTDIND